MNNTLRIKPENESLEEVKRRLSAVSDDVILSLETSVVAKTKWVTSTWLSEILCALSEHLKDNYNRDYW